MADIFISFKSSDFARVSPLRKALLRRGLSVFWSTDIQIGSSNYQTVIADEIKRAGVVLVVWTEASVDSHAVVQECVQAERDGKLIQVVFDEFDPIRFPMDVSFRAQKAMLIGWTGDQRHPEWSRLVTAVDARLSLAGAAQPQSTASRIDDATEDGKRRESASGRFANPWPLAIGAVLGLLILGSIALALMGIPLRRGHDQSPPQLVPPVATDTDANARGAGVTKRQTEAAEQAKRDQEAKARADAEARRQLEQQKQRDADRQLAQDAAAERARAKKQREEDARRRARDVPSSCPPNYRAPDGSCYTRER